MDEGRKGDESYTKWQPEKRENLSNVSHYYSMEGRSDKVLVGKGAIHLNTVFLRKLIRKD